MYNKTMAEFIDYIPEGEVDTNAPKKGFVDYKPLYELDKTKVSSDKVVKITKPVVKKQPTKKHDTTKKSR